MSKQTGLYARPAGSAGSPITSEADLKYIKEFAVNPLRLRRFRRGLIFDKPHNLGSVLIVVLSYNSKEDSLECLRSISRQRYADLGLLIIDNASTDGAPEAIRAADSGAALISLSENRGWAGGNNLGVKIAIENKYEYVLLLNNDTILNDDTVSHLMQRAVLLEPCLLHPAIYYHDQAEDAQLDPSIGREDIDGSSNPSDLFELDFAYGACLLIHTEIFRKIGLFDERFFLQLEETDFFLRAKKAGFRSFCFTGTRIYHKESRSFGGRRTPQKTYYITRNMLLILEKHHRTPASIIAGLKKFYWSLSYLASESHTSLRLTEFLLWFLSQDAFAAAARLGVRDYVLRRFGKITKPGLR